DRQQEDGVDEHCGRDHERNPVGLDPDVVDDRGPPPVRRLQRRAGWWAVRLHHHRRAHTRKIADTRRRIRQKNPTREHTEWGSISRSYVELRGFEPLTSSLRTKRSTN